MLQPRQHPPVAGPAGPSPAARRSPRQRSRVTRVQQRLADAGPVDLDFGDRRRLEALHQRQVARGQVLERLVQGEFGPPPQLVLQRPPHGRGDEDLAAPRLAVAERILPRLVEIELVVGVLDQRYGQALGTEAGDQLLDEGRLAAARPAGEAEYAPVWPWSPLADDRADKLALGVGVILRLAHAGAQDRALLGLIGVAQRRIGAQRVAEAAQRFLFRAVACRSGGRAGDSACRRARSRLRASAAPRERYEPTFWR